MKCRARAFALLVVLILGVCGHTFANAEDEIWNHYDLPEIGLNISFPDGFDILTRDMPEDAPVLALYDLTSDEVNDILVPGNMYLDAISFDGTKEIVVIMIGSSISDFSLLGDTVLNFMASTWIDEFEKSGRIIDKYDIYHHGDITFVRIWQHWLSNPNLHTLQYYTTYDNQAINITMHSLNGKISADDEILIENVVSRTVFSKSSGEPVVYATETAETEFQYEVLDDGSARITGYNGLQASISIPESIDGYTVRSIATMETKFSSVTTVFIPATVDTICGNPFTEFDGLKAIAVAEDNPAFVSDGGILYSTGKERLVCYPPQLKQDAFTLPPETKIIGSKAFYGCDNIVFIELSNGLQVIETDAFSCADSITDIFIPRTVTRIDGNPFNYSYGLMSISVDPLNRYYYAQDGVLFSRIDKKLQAFPHNKSISHYSIPEGIIVVGEDAFNWYPNKATITFPKSLRRVETCAFANTKFEFPALMEDFEIVGEFAFGDCDTITSIVIPATANVQRQAFGRCSGLTSVQLQDGVTEVCDYMFFECKALTNVELPETLISIGEHAFRLCESLEKVVIPSGVQYIGERAFDDCPNLVLYVQSGTYSEDYCKANGIKYEVYSVSAYQNRIEYFDPVSNLSFYLPTGWKQTDMSKERTYIDAKFIPENNDGTTIIFTCEDLWMSFSAAERTELEKYGYSRKDFDNSLYTVADVASDLEIPVEEISIVSYSNQEYFMVTTTSVANVLGFDVPFKMTELMCMNNGYIYMFQFGGFGSNYSRYEEFEEMMNSIKWR